MGQEITIENVCLYDAKTGQLVMEINDGLSTIDCVSESNDPRVFIPAQQDISLTVTLKLPRMSRKKFIKRMMRFGLSRNQANQVATLRPRNLSFIQHYWNVVCLGMIYANG